MQVLCWGDARGDSIAMVSIRVFLVRRLSQRRRSGVLLGVHGRGSSEKSGVDAALAIEKDEGEIEG